MFSWVWKWGWKSPCERTVLHFYCWSSCLSTCEVVFDLGLSLGFVLIKGGKRNSGGPCRMGLEQGGSPCTEQALVSNFLSHFVKWTCEAIAKPRLQRQTPCGQIAGSCLTQLCWAFPHSFPVRSQLYLFTTEKLPRMTRLALRDWVFFWRQVLITLQSTDAFCDS